MSDVSILAEVSNDNQTLVAVVQQDSRTAYFYLYPIEEDNRGFQVRACWLRNVQPAPQHEDLAAIAAGQPPMLAEKYCVESAGEPPLQSEGLRVIWTESDDGAALWYYDQLLAVIPATGLYLGNGLAYSVSCIKENPLVSPLHTDDPLYRQAEKTRQFWSCWQQQEGNPWPQMQHDYHAHYAAHFGPSVKYYAIDQGKWPPMAITQHQQDGIYYFLTTGMSIRPMPWVDALFDAETATAYRRIEMAMAVDARLVTEDQALQMASALAGFAQVPWAKITWLGEAHLLASEVAPVGYEGYIFSSLFYPHHQNLHLPQQADDPVTLLWASPFFATEHAWVNETEKGGSELVIKLSEQGVDHIFRPRQPLNLRFNQN